MATFSNGETGLSVRTKLNEVLQHLDGTGSELIVNSSSSSVNFRVKTSTSAHALFVNGTNRRVGIGTESPSVPLDVVGNAAIAGQLTITSSAGGGLRINDTSGGTDAYVTLATNGTDRFSLAADAGSGSFYLFDEQNVTYPFVAKPGSASNTLVIGNSKVGIGKLSPAQALDVVGNIAVTGTVDGRNVSVDGSKLDGIESGADVTDTANVTAAIGQSVGTSASPSFAGLTVDTNVLHVDSANNRVGVGTTSPSAKLDVVGDAEINGQLAITSSAGGGLRINDTSGGTDAYVTLATSGTDRFSLAADAATGSFYLFDEQTVTYPFGATPGSASNTLVIDNSRVGIGTASPSQKLDVVGNAEINGNITVTGTVDGRDVAADGTKLDGIEAGADVTDTANVTAAIGQSVGTSASPTFAGQTINGQLAITSSAGGGLRINDTSGGTDAYVTLATSGTDRFSLSADAATGSFYLFDEQNSTYPFAVTPGGSSNLFVINGSTDRVGIGTASPSATLDVVGNAEINGALTISTSGYLKLLVDDGVDTPFSVGAGTSAVTIANNTGATTTDEYITLNQNDSTVRIGAGGSEAVRINSSGNFGIGTTSPSARLDVVGDAEINGRLEVISSAGGGLRVNDTSGGIDAYVTLATSGTDRFSLSADAATGSFYLFDDQNSSYPFAVTPGSASSTLVIDNSRVGVGTNSPSETLDVVGTAEFNGIVYITDRIAHEGDTDNYMQFHATDQWRVVTGGTERLEVTNSAVSVSGSFGIGTNSPSAKLDVVGNAEINGNAVVTGTTQTKKINGFGTEVVINAGEAANYATGQTGELVYVNAEGGLQINASPDNWSSGWAGRVSSRISATEATFPQVYSSTTALGSNVRVAGGGRLYRSTSSLKYKHNVEDADLALSEAVVYGSRPVWYQSLSDLDNDAWGFWGFIAEELHEVDPRLVDYAEDENGDLTPDGVQYDRFTVHLVNVAQKQKARIDDLEARLAALEAKLQDGA